MGLETWKKMLRYTIPRLANGAACQEFKLPQSSRKIQKMQSWEFLIVQTTMECSILGQTGQVKHPHLFPIFVIFSRCCDFSTSYAAVVHPCCSWNQVQAALFLVSSKHTKLASVQLSSCSVPCWAKHPNELVFHGWRGIKNTSRHTVCHHSVDCSCSCAVTELNIIMRLYHVPFHLAGLLLTHLSVQQSWWQHGKWKLGDVRQGQDSQLWGLRSLRLGMHLSVLISE